MERLNWHPQDETFLLQQSFKIFYPIIFIDFNLRCHAENDPMKCYSSFNIVTSVKISYELI